MKSHNINTYIVRIDNIAIQGNMSYHKLFLVEVAY